MGDFNVDLLKVSDNNAAGDFYNMFSSYFLTPFVLQPSRLKAKTLIDDIFLNSLEYSVLLSTHLGSNLHRSIGKQDLQPL